jgi:lipase
VRLVAHEFGPGSHPTVLALHGVRNHGRRFRRLADDAYPTSRVIAPDLRGHGASGWEPPWDVDTHVDDLCQTLDACGISRPVEIVAHSFGGLVAIALARAQPGRVRSMTLLDPAAGIDPAACLAAADLDIRGIGRAATWDSRADAEDAWSAVRPPEGQWARDEDLDAFLCRDRQGRYRLRYSRAAAVAAWSEMARPVSDLGAWQGPVTLVTALREPYVSDALRTMLRRRCGAHLTEVDIDCGHIVMWDAPERTAQIVAAARPPA